MIVFTNMLGYLSVILPHFLLTVISKVLEKFDPDGMYLNSHFLILWSVMKRTSSDPLGKRLVLKEIWAQMGPLLIIEGPSLPYHSCPFMSYCNFYSS